jgi:hypothetical protein
METECYYCQLRKTGNCPGKGISAQSLDICLKEGRTETTVLQQEINKNNN